MGENVTKKLAPTQVITSATDSTGGRLPKYISKHGRFVLDQLQVFHNTNCNKDL